MSGIITSNDWAIRISATWRQSVEAVIETGRLLAAAKVALPHGEFLAMIESQLPFEARTAQMLMKIAADGRLTDTKHVSLLPPHWGTLYELTKLPDEHFEARVIDGTIRPDMQRADIATQVKRVARETRERELGARQRALPQKKYGVIVADPEWRFEPRSRETGLDRAPDNHYPTSPTDEIAARPVPSITADDCALFLWATAPMLPDALRVMAAWGFDYKTHAAWLKDRAGDAHGPGYWFWGEHELLMLGTKGKIPAPAPGLQWISYFHAPVGRHSGKPDLALQMIEAYFPTLPKIELNRRGPARPGWDAWGNEAEAA